MRTKPTGRFQDRTCQSLLLLDRSHNGEVATFDRGLLALPNRHWAQAQLVGSSGRLPNPWADAAAWATVCGVDYRKDLGSVVVTRCTISTDPPRGRVDISESGDKQ